MVEEPGKQKTVLDVIKEQIASLVETVTALAADVEELKKRPYAKRQLFGGKSERRPVVDTTTGTVYVSLSAVGKALAKEADTTPDDHFAYYKLSTKFPDRFRDATEEEAAVAIAEEEAQIAAALAKAEAEEKAAAEKEAGKTPGGKKGK